MKQATDLHYLAIDYISFNGSVSMKRLSRLLDCDKRTVRQIIYDIRKAYVKTANNELLPYVCSDMNGYSIAGEREMLETKSLIQHKIIELARELKVINYMLLGKNQIELLEVKK